MIIDISADAFLKFYDQTTILWCITHQTGTFSIRNPLRWISFGILCRDYEYSYCFNIVSRARQMIQKTIQLGNGNWTLCPPYKIGKGKSLRIVCCLNWCTIFIFHRNIWNIFSGCSVWRSMKSLMCICASQRSWWVLTEVGIIFWTHPLRIWLGF